ncbi:DUF6153 family protein [Streptomyces zaomyceticus]|uniref:DUF6153 family protein n=1 Tax=Streptomyces zaomyceticus TaxID=68286 RepID=UPI0034127AA5
MLALGVFLMHTVGHPEGSGGGMDATSATAPGTVAAAVAAGHEPGHRAHGGTGSGIGADHEPSGTGMDMTTLCVAVLAGWLLTALVRAALVRRPDWLTLLLARLAPAPGPHAPPARPPDLARLSVLRI